MSMKLCLKAEGRKEGKKEVNKAGLDQRRKMNFPSIDGRQRRKKQIR